MTDRPTIATGCAQPSPDLGDAPSDETRSSDVSEGRLPKASAKLIPADGAGDLPVDATQIGRDAAAGGMGDGQDEIAATSGTVIQTAAELAREEARENRRERKKLSMILAEITNDTARARISVGDLVTELQRRAFGAMLLIFALPNAVPTPPGTSAILGLPLLYLTFQLMMGHTPWLPKFIANRSMNRSDMAALVERISPMLQRAEKLLVPRLLVLSTPLAERIAGALCLVLAIVLVLPIPLGNMLPAFAISVIALGILEKDGIWIAAGAVIGVLSLLIVWGVVYALAKTFVFIILHAFS